MKIEFPEIGMIEVESFYNQLLEDILKFDQTVYTLDFSEVEIISLPAIQVLIAFKKHCDEKCIELQCTNIHSNNILQSLETYNLNDTLGIKI